MELTDAVPSQDPSEQQQLDALHIGLGRAGIWAQQGQLSPDLLLQACLEDWRFDLQIDDPRSDWLWELMGWLGVRDSFRTFILEDLINSTDDSPVYQLCQLVGHYAAEGDQPCRSTLRHLVELCQFPDRPYVAEKEILRIDGAEGFKFLTRIRGEALKSSDWEWHNDAFVRDASERLGEEMVRSILNESHDPDIVRFTEAWKAQPPSQPWEAGREARERRNRWPADRIIRFAHTGDPCRWFSGWGIKADHKSLSQVADVLWQSDNPELILRLLLVFNRMELPQFHLRLVEFCQHEDERLRRNAYQALAMNSHEVVRQIAVERLEQGDFAQAAELFVRNFRSGDEQRLLGAIRQPIDDDQLHGFLINVCDLFEENLEADVSQLGIWSYLNNPCSFCRESLVRLLVSRGQAPLWLREEARYDASNEIRQLVLESA